MKRRTAAVLGGLLALSLTLGGCQSSKGLETDALKITKYKGVEVEQVEKPEEITDEEVEATIQANLESQATTTEITDRAVENGDTVNIDFVGKMDGKEFDGGAAEDYPLTIGSGSFIEGFEDSVIGHKIGDTYDWNGTFPDDYGNAEMAGKDVVFTITVNSITVEEVPELTEEIIKTLSDESTTVEEYKKEVKAQLEDEAQTSYDETLKQNAWQVVAENTEVKKYPDGEVEELVTSLVDAYKEAAEYYQMEYETFIEEQMGYTPEQLEEEAKAAAKENIKEQMAVEAIAKEEKIEMDDETYEKELEKMSEEYGYESVDDFKEAFEEDDLKDAVLKSLVMDYVKEHCIQIAAE